MSGSASFHHVYACEGLFLAQKIEVGVTAGARIYDGGEVSGNRVGAMICVKRRKRKQDFQR